MEAIGTYKDGTLRENLLSYSKDRMKRDGKYKRDVNRALAERRRARQLAQKDASGT